MTQAPNTINPKFDTFMISTEWGEANSDYWGKEVEVFIKDLTLDGPDKSIGEIFYLTICSPKFVLDPNTEVTDDDITKALVMEKFDEPMVEKYLRNAIDVIGPVDINKFEQAMRKKFDMSDWDQIDELIPNSD